MGMYTELFISTMVRDDPKAASVLKHMLEAPGEPPELPDHPLFKCDRWDFMLRCNSYYFVPRSVHVFEFDEISKGWVFISRSDFKNYSQEIEKFIDWLRPHLACGADEMIGYYRYEQSREPTIIYSTETK